LVGNESSHHNSPFNKDARRYISMQKDQRVRLRDSILFPLRFCVSNPEGGKDSHSKLHSFEIRSDRAWIIKRCRFDQLDMQHSRNPWQGMYFLIVTYGSRLLTNLFLSWKSTSRIMVARVSLLKSNSNGRTSMSCPRERVAHLR
jgi:hypothetical protein